MRVLVTGATGFIGSTLVPRLLARGHEVRALVRSTSDITTLPKAVDVVRGELGDARAALDGIAGLIHLAGISGSILGRRPSPNEPLWRTNVDGTEKLFVDASAAGIRHAVHVSSMWTVLRPDLASRSRYIESRIASERKAFDAGASGMEVTCVCPTFVVGAGDRGPNFPGALVLAFLRGRLPLSPPGGMTWIAVEDAADALITALERGEPGARYVIGTEHIAHHELFTRLSRIAERKPPKAAAPRAALSAAAVVADAAVAVFGRRFPLPLRFGVELLGVDHPIDCDAARRALGEPRVAIDHALAEAVAWFVTHGYL